MHSVGYFPNFLENARLKPLFKTGDMENPKNYRPISWLSSLSNFFGKIAVKSFEIFWEKCDVLNSKQCGFRKGKSTLNALLDFTKTFFFAKISKSAKKLSARFWLWVRHLIQSITEFCSKNLKLLVSEEFFSNCWRVSQKILSNLYTLMKKIQMFEM